MGILELFVLAIGLSMDAFAVSICKGLSVQKLELKHMLIVGAYFGGFQALMPAIGYLLGSQFEHLIVSVDHWIAFFLLLFIGGNMIKESREGDVDELDDDFGLKTMLLLAVATSIDALA
ncbi:MAG: manganese efflux pump, partial [Peptococcaceae bacterium]|nr:manganese efflux pump [Peptococcaceae bacterium]